MYSSLLRTSSLSLGSIPVTDTTDLVSFAAISLAFAVQSIRASTVAKGTLSVYNYSARKVHL